MHKNSFLNLIKLIKNSKHNKIIIYSEGRAYYPHFEEIINHLLKSKMEFLYYTSDKNDLCFKNELINLRSFYIGKGITRLLFFSLLDCKILIMTMPDLDNYHIKRSKNGVHYIYIQHSLLSMHMAYNKNAFNNYDTIFCSSNYQVDELTKLEKRYGLKIKTKIKHGYGKIDILRREKNIQNYKSNYILLAPSWHINSLLDKNIDLLIDQLIDNNFIVHFRPHNESILRNKKKINKIRKKYTDNSKFIYDNHSNGNEGIINAEILITDWSGIAYEFSFSTLRPTLFINTKKKINNIDYKNINSTPFEISSRRKIGISIAEDEINNVVYSIKFLKQKKSDFYLSIKNIRDDCIFNIDKSGKIAVNQIKRILKYEKIPD